MLSKNGGYIEFRIEPFRSLQGNSNHGNINLSVFFYKKVFLLLEDFPQQQPISSDKTTHLN